jgi:Flp pilus assembly protein TadB
VRARPQGVTVAAVNDEGLGGRFWLKLVGVCLACGLVGLILFLLMSRAVYRWGFLGGFLAFALLLLLVGWVWDRRNARRYERED